MLKSIDPINVHYALGILLSPHNLIGTLILSMYIVVFSQCFIFSSLNSFVPLPLIFETLSPILLINNKLHYLLMIMTERSSYSSVWCLLRLAPIRVFNKINSVGQIWGSTGFGQLMQSIERSRSQLDACCSTALCFIMM